MGLIKAAIDSISSSLADSWLEVIEPDNMDDRTLMVRGISQRTSNKGANKKGSQNVISNGSVIHVYPNMMMLLMDNGKVIDYTAEEGMYTVNNSSAPSLFNGELGEAIKDTFNRFKFGGVPSGNQQAIYINLQEIKGIKFGTKNPVNYFDNFYNAELFLRAHGSYSIRITDPLKFFFEAVPRNSERCVVDDINEQYLAEFLDALQSTINQMSADGVRISYVSSKSREVSKYMANTLDDDWRNGRGIEVVSVGLQSVSYDPESQRLINMRNEAGIMSSPDIQDSYMKKNIAESFKAAAGNSGGAAMGFFGMNMAQNTAANMSGLFNNTQQQQQQQQQQPQQPQYQPQQQQSSGTAAWKCECGTSNTGNFCSNCGKSKPSAPAEWRCTCGMMNTGNFCSHCGRGSPAGDSR
ncbi:MAG: SPFH domain-containing protein [Ruminococcus sp.]|jgi:membrane protease subunit (stomatin/prohibitin family)|nr:SPFH domain-containing protein [Ruminococcus sp.]